MWQRNMFSCPGRICAQEVQRQGERASARERPGWNPDAVFSLHYKRDCRKQKETKGKEKTGLEKAAHPEPELFIPHFVLSNIEWAELGKCILFWFILKPSGKPLFLWPFPFREKRMTIPSHPGRWVRKCGYLEAFRIHGPRLQAREMCSRAVHCECLSSAWLVLRAGKEVCPGDGLTEELWKLPYLESLLYPLCCDSLLKPPSLHKALDYLTSNYGRLKESGLPTLGKVVKTHAAAGWRERGNRAQRAVR